MEFQRIGKGGMRAATANVNVHAMVYYIDFFFLLLKIRLVRKLFFGRSKRLRLVYAAKKFGKSMVLFFEILLSKNGTALSTGTALNYLGQPKETVRKNV